MNQKEGPQYSTILPTGPRCIFSILISFLPIVHRYVYLFLPWKWSMQRVEMACFKARLPWRSTTIWWRWGERLCHVFTVPKKKTYVMGVDPGEDQHLFMVSQLWISNSNHRDEGMRISGHEKMILKFWLRDLTVANSTKKWTQESRSQPMWSG